MGFRKSWHNVSASSRASQKHPNYIFIQSETPETVLGATTMRSVSSAQTWRSSSSRRGHRAAKVAGTATSLSSQYQAIMQS
ncbi:hypothetical protein IG631_07215 [Alternaria alternata]|nr:hypothetical protein IG631_07215 [Alternaria alternata]